MGADSLPGSLGVTTDYVNKDNNNWHTEIENILETADTTIVRNIPGNCDACFFTLFNPTKLGNLKFC
jgi:hypothetical protein